MIVCLPTPILADGIIHKYERVANLEINTQTSDSATSNSEKAVYYEAEIPLDLIENTEVYDLRILDKNGREIPFITEIIGQKPTLTSKEISIFNKSISIDGNKQIFFLDLKKNSNQKINQIEFNIEENNFERSISLFGQNEIADKQPVLIAENLKIIGKYIPTQNIKFKHSQINFPESQYKYIRVEIEIPKNEKPLGINSAEVIHYTENKVFKYNVDLPFQKITLPNLEKNKNIDYWLLDLKNKKYSLDKLELRLNEDNFYRPANLYCSSKKKIEYLDDESIKYITSTYLYKHGSASQRLGIDLSSDYARNCSYYLLSINQGNNIPITPKSIIGMRDRVYLKFAYEKPYEKPLSIYSKSKEMIVANYDLEERLQSIKVDGFEKGNIVQLKINPQFIKPKPNKTEKINFFFESKKYLVYLVIFILILAIGLYIRKTVLEMNAKR
jgi:hypothetical protein